MLPVMLGSCLGGGMMLALYAAQSAYYYRALPDLSYAGEIAPSSRMRELDTRIVPLGLSIARSIVLMLTSSVMKCLMNVCNNVEYVDDKNYRFLLSTIRSRPAGVPLLTVANHQSSLDDPGLMSALIPWDVFLTPSRVRWGLATQDIVFPPKDSFVQSFMTCGQVMPVHRGGGIDQALFLDFARQMAAGRWVHIFPEARVVQTGTLATDAITRRDSQELEHKGMLKWGTGKLIAHSRVPPIVVPFYHYGMVGVLPQHNVWKQRENGEPFFHNNVVEWKPHWGNKVKVWVGEPVEYQDLLDEYEKQHGPLWKVSPTPTATEEEFRELLDSWVSSDIEKELYSKITRRIQQALVDMEAKAKRDLEETPEPKVKSLCERAIEAMKKRHEFVPKLKPA